MKAPHPASQPGHSGGDRSPELPLGAETLVGGGSERAGDHPLYVEFVLGEVRYALIAERVIEITLRVRITHLPGAPAVVLGVVNYRGSATAVVDLRRRLGHEPRSGERDDHLVFVRTDRRTLGLLVDRVVGLRWLSLAEIGAAPVKTPHLEGVVTLPDGVLLIQDPDRVLLLDESEALSQALEAAPSGAGP